MIVVSFSGGRTSAFMSWWLKNNSSEELRVVFANTGQEHESTLEFVNRCDKEWGLCVVWLEAKVNAGRAGTTYTVVDFKSASRNGEPFERVIEKYGIPNQSYPHCTRELKLAPINSWAKDNCPPDRKMAVGIRADEMDRMQANAKEKNIIYPLVSKIPTDKSMVNRFFEAQDFDLDIPALMGNCTWCWKKTTRKHLTLLNTNPEIYDFPERMEREHPDPKESQFDTGENRVFFRQGTSTIKLRNMALQPFKRWDEEYQPDLFNEWDVSSGCVESCDVEF